MPPEGVPRDVFTGEEAPTGPVLYCIVNGFMVLYTVYVLGRVRKKVVGGSPLFPWALAHNFGTFTS